MTNTDQEFGWGDEVIWFGLGVAYLGRFERYVSSDSVEVLPLGQSAGSVTVPLSDVLMLRPRNDHIIHAGAQHEIAALVKEHSGEWVCVEEVGISDDPRFDKEARARLSNRASLIKQGRLRAFQPRGCYNAHSLRERDSNGNAVYRVYARYVGVEDAVSVEDLFG